MKSIFYYICTFLVIYDFLKFAIRNYVHPAIKEINSLTQWKRVCDHHCMSLGKSPMTCLCLWVIVMIINNKHLF